jgi:hypothetical protein
MIAGVGSLFLALIRSATCPCSQWLQIPRNLPFNMQTTARGPWRVNPRRSGHFRGNVPRCPTKPHLPIIPPPYSRVTGRCGARAVVAQHAYALLLNKGTLRGLLVSLYDHQLQTNKTWTLTYAVKEYQVKTGLGRSPGFGREKHND